MKKSSTTTNETIQSVFMPLELLRLIMIDNIYVMSIFNQISKYWHTETESMVKGILFKIFLLYLPYLYKKIIFSVNVMYSKLLKMIL